MSNKVTEFEKKQLMHAVETGRKLTKSKVKKIFRNNKAMLHRLFPDEYPAPEDVPVELVNGLNDIKEGKPLTLYSPEDDKDEDTSN